MKKILLITTLLLSSYLNAFNDIKHWYSGNGAQVYFIQEKSIPMLDIQITFDAAASREKKLYGLANITNSVIGMGSKKYTEEQIIDIFDINGANFSRSSHRDMAVISLRTLTRKKNFNNSLSLFTEIISNPTFPEKNITRVKKQIIQSIQKNHQEPSSILSMAFDKAVFGNHPYAHNILGTTATVYSINRRNIVSFYNKNYVSTNMIIALVGNINIKQAREIADNISKQFNKGIKNKPLKKVNKLTKSYTKNINFPSQQSHLMIGQVGISRNNKNYFPLYVGNHIFGGSPFVSELSVAIREKRGLAYSVYSYFSPMMANGYFSISLQTENKQLKKARKISLDKLKKFINKIVDKKILKEAKDNIMGNYALNTATNASLVNYLSIIGFYKLPIDYLDTFKQKVMQVSANDIQKSFKKIIDMDKLVIISVGNLK